MTDINIPAAYPGHTHASEEARRIAENGLILLTEVGSGVHGTSISGQDDRDEMGICFEPKEHVLGLARVPAGAHDGTGRWIPFEQYERHTAWDRGGLRERSGAGDLDTLIYGARKWARLAIDGNPTVLIPLFAPTAAVQVSEPAAESLRANGWRLASKQSVQRFLGYLRSQRDAMTGERTKRTNRPELVAIHGYDTKFAMHALRLGIQGVEFATTGRISLPIPEPQLSRLRAIRRGDVDLDSVLADIADHEQRLSALLEDAELPARGDLDWLNGWLIDGYEAFWASR